MSAAGNGSGAEAAMRCVLCGGPNDCAIARRAALEAAGAEPASDASPCWCVERSFPATLTARASRADGRRRCICRACLDAEVAD